MARADELWVITSYFNPAGHQSRRENYRQFRAALGNKPCLTIECALADRPFELSPSHDVVQVRAHHTLWHKERLLNLAIAKLPPSCRYVAWIDADVLFERLDWEESAIALLDRHVAVQLFREVLLLPAPSRPAEAIDRTYGIAATIAADPATLFAGRFDTHGHTGYAWAARRELLDAAPLYDACIVGSADHVMAHAMLFEPSATCVTRLLGNNTPHLRHFHAWADRLHTVCERLGLSGLGFVPGTIRHLWHGSPIERRYFERNQRLRQLGFDPAKDLLAEPDQPWRLCAPDGPIARFLIDYFAQRNEDSTD